MCVLVPVESVVGVGRVREERDWEGCEGKAVVDEEGEEVDGWEEGDGERRERRLGSLDLEALISRSTLCAVVRVLDS